MTTTAHLASIPIGVKIRPDPISRVANAGKIIATGGHTAEMSIRAECHPN